MKPKKRTKKAVAEAPSVTGLGREFLQGVLIRLRPDNLRQVVKHKLSTDFLTNLSGAVFEMIARTPELRKALDEWHPPATPNEIRRDMTLWANADGTGTLRRALAAGLDVRLAELENQGRRAEAGAWQTSIDCGCVDHYNKTAALPGYEDAMASVDAARLARMKTKAKTWRSQVTMMRWGTTLPLALLHYWLPLGLWAMSIEDAIRTLRLLSLPRLVSRSRNPEWRSYFDAHPDEARAFEAACPASLQPKVRAAHTRFSKEVRALKLYRAGVPLTKLAQAGPCRTRSEIEAAKTDPQQWIIVSMAGDALPGKW